MGYQWKPIADLESDWDKMRVEELESLSVVWKEQSGRLKATNAFQIFNQKLQREWAIETGILENLYTIDRGVTMVLIEKGIEASLIPHGATDRPAEEVVNIVRDQQQALEGVFDFVSRRRELSTSYIKELHQLLTRHQVSTQAINGTGKKVEIELLRGDWKKHPNNPCRPDAEMHEYCPPDQVSSEMDNLISIHVEHVQKQVPPEIEAAWLHHRFTQIHPFQDGNGRIARALASLVFLRAEWFPLVVDRDQRARYVESLEKADYGDLKPLIVLFSELQKKAFIKALSISQTVLVEREPLKQIAAAAREMLEVRSAEHLKEKQKRCNDIARRLEDIVNEKLRDVSKLLNEQLKGVDRSYAVNCDRSDKNSKKWFWDQIISTARKLGYFADLRTYSSWLRIKIREERQAEIVFSFHSLGVMPSGLMAVSAFLEYRQRTDASESSIEGPYLSCNDVFQFAYNESVQVVENRFRQWLDEAVIIGLDRWQTSL